MEDNRKILMAVAFNDVTNQYSVDLGAGSSVPETAFAMAIVIKCLLKDGIIKDASEVTDLLNKYLTDPQYNEVKETEGE
jgi:hypothetical protein